MNITRERNEIRDGSWPGYWLRVEDETAPGKVALIFLHTKDDDCYVYCGAIRTIYT